MAVLFFVPGEGLGSMLFAPLADSICDKRSNDGQRAQDCRYRYTIYIAYAQITLRCRRQDMKQYPELWYTVVGKLRLTYQSSLTGKLIGGTSKEPLLSAH